MPIRNYSCIFILLIILIPAHVTAQNAEFTPIVKAIDHIVAIVNEDAITEGRMKPLKPLSIDSNCRHSVLISRRWKICTESIVAKRIQLQHAKVGLSVSEAKLMKITSYR
jgi:peptidyl-prolyl cis-trans isomerase SurA